MEMGGVFFGSRARWNLSHQAANVEELGDRGKPPLRHFSGNNFFEGFILFL